jgi:hypothetical protein
LATRAETLTVSFAGLLLESSNDLVELPNKGRDCAKLRPQGERLGFGRSWQLAHVNILDLFSFFARYPSNMTAPTMDGRDCLHRVQAFYRTSELDDQNGLPQSNITLTPTVFRARALVPTATWP